MFDNNTQKLEELRCMHRKELEILHQIIDDSHKETLKYKALYERGLQDLVRENQLIFSAFYQLGAQLYSLK